MIYNVKDYSAKGNGITDDTQAIQRAIEAAAKAGGGQVYVPAGTYVVSAGDEPGDGCLMLRDNVQLYGAGMGKTIIKVADGSDSKITGVIRSAYGEQNHDFGISDLTIDGNRDNTSGKIDGWFNGYIPGKAGHDSNVTIDSVEIKNCSGYGFDPHEQTWNMVIKNSVAHGNGLDGFVADFLVNSSFVNNTSYDNDRHGFNVVTSTNDFTMRDNKAYNNGSTGIVLQRGDEDIPAPNDITITGGSVYGNKAEGVLLKMVHDVTVSGVDIHDNARSGVRLYGSTGIELLDNDIQNNSLAVTSPEVVIQSFDDTRGASGDYFNGSNNLIRDNTIVGSDRSTYGVAEVDEKGTDHNTLINNAISHVSRGATALYGDGSTVSGSQGPLLGTGGDDNLLGTGANETLMGYAGKDVINGAGGNDVLVGGAGADKLTGGTGSDTFRFTAASDSYRTASVKAKDTLTDFSTSGDKIDVAALGFTGLGNGHGNTLQVSYDATSKLTYLKDYDADANGARFELGLSGNYLSSLKASSFIFAKAPTAPLDTSAPEAAVAAAAVANPLNGTAGDDTLIGDGPANIINGLAGKDSIDGMGGNDRLTGGAGVDTLTGGTGTDTFVYTAVSDSFRSTSGTVASDLIKDFSTDRIDLSALGITGLGDGKGTTVSVTTSSDGSKTYIKSYVADAAGERLEISLQGNQVANLAANRFIFAGTASTTLTGTSGSDSLVGTANGETLLGLGGNDTLKGGDGNDTLDGGAGKDSLYGQAGADTFRFSELLDSYRDYDSGGATVTDTIFDFVRGQDKIDVSALGFSALGSGNGRTLYTTYSASADKTYVKNADADADGNRFEIALSGNLALTASDFVFTPRTTAGIEFLPTLGQSNARLMRVTEDDNQSGITELVKDLARYTSLDVRSQFDDANGNPIDVAIGGTTVTGLSTATTEEKNLSWWFTDTNKPGPVLTRAVDLLKSQIATLSKSGPVNLDIIWGQGEEGAQAIARASDKAAAEALYKASTLKVFDYLHAQLGDFTIYLMETGHYAEDGARYRGYSESKIASIVDGTVHVRHAQEAMAAERADVQLAVDYTDLPLRQEADPVTYPDDVWHLHEESAEIVGQRLADYIANDLGYKGDPSDNNDPGDITASTSNQNGRVQGTDVADTLVAAGSQSQVLNGDLGADTLIDQGTGSTLYIVDDLGDTVTETDANTAHIDTVQSSVSWTLGSNVEELDLAGDKALAGTGNALDNTLTGNSGNNVLDGKGGSDTLIGGAGADVFRFSAWRDLGVGAERDQIGEFSASEGDKVDLTALDANTRTAVVDTFKFIGSAAFSADATGELRFADGVLQGSQDADGAPEFEVRMLGLDTFRSVDLVG
ncbi:M10 family metallopeptidase C-terminal domain-containing protein [Pseudomonas massiliensis]|uniref:M10 family metallopeptidase C-terminal domain-containing protein n=1 Tax=Pseudomonas massiliensis TaxID=522492 RepID=UPI00058F1E18|nr:glycosyl hydrolase family 28-related protein [Pseudomonas massiliensis]